MYPQPTNLSPSTSTAAPKPTSIFQPSSTDKSTESSPQSSLPWEQRTPAASTSSSDAPSSHTPPQPFVHSQHQPKIPAPTQHTSPKPHNQQIQQTPVKTNANQPTQPSISDEDQQCVPKSTNSSQVKCSKQQPKQQNECLCFYCNQPGHLKRSCPKIPYCSKCRTRGHAPTNHRGTGTRTKLENPETNKKETKISHSFQAVTIGVCSVQEIIRPQIVQRHNNDKLQPLTVPLVVQVPRYTKMHLTPHIHLLILTHNHQPHTVNLPYMYKCQPLTLMIPHSHLNYTKFLSHHLHKITKALITTPINNKYTHHQHNLLMHSFHNLSTLMFHHHIFHSIHLLTVYLHMALILQSC